MEQGGPAAPPQIGAPAEAPELPAAAPTAAAPAGLAVLVGGVEAGSAEPAGEEPEWQAAALGGLPSAVGDDLRPRDEAAGAASRAEPHPALDGAGAAARETPEPEPPLRCPAAAEAPLAAPAGGGGMEGLGPQPPSEPAPAGRPRRSRCSEAPMAVFPDSQQLDVPWPTSSVRTPSVSSVSSSCGGRRAAAQEAAEAVSAELAASLQLPGLPMPGDPQASSPALPPPPPLPVAAPPPLEQPPSLGAYAVLSRAHQSLQSLGTVGAEEDEEEVARRPVWQAVTHESMVEVLRRTAQDWPDLVVERPLLDVPCPTTGVCVVGR